MSLVGNQTRKVYSFKGAGNNVADIPESVDTPVRQKPPIGIKTPLELSIDNGLFTICLLYTSPSQRDATL